MKSINTELKRIRKERGVTQRELADAIGVAPSTISGYELGTRIPDYTVLEKIAKRLNVSIFDFLDDSGASELIKNYYEIEQMIHKIARLDAADRARIDERLTMMLESDKYKTYKKAI